LWQKLHRFVETPDRKRRASASDDDDDDDAADDDDNNDDDDDGNDENDDDDSAPMDVDTEPGKNIAGQQATATGATTSGAKQPSQPPKQVCTCPCGLVTKTHHF
jgi:hypothetical protein